VNLNDPAEALEIIFLANYWLRIVDTRARSLAPMGKAYPMKVDTGTRRYRNYGIA